MCCWRGLWGGCTGDVSSTGVSISEICSVSTGSTATEVSVGASPEGSSATIALSSWFSSVTTGSFCSSSTGTVTDPDTGVEDDTSRVSSFCTRRGLAMTAVVSAPEPPTLYVASTVLLTSFGTNL